MDLFSYVSKEELLETIIKNNPEKFDWENFIKNENIKFDFLQKYLKYINIKNKTFILKYYIDILKSKNELLNQKEYYDYISTVITFINFNIYKIYKNKLKNYKGAILLNDNDKKKYKEFLLKNNIFIKNTLIYWFENNNISEIIKLINIFEQKKIIEILFENIELYKYQKFIYYLYKDNYLSINNIDFSKLKYIIIFYFIYDKRFENI